MRHLSLVRFDFRHNHKDRECKCATCEEGSNADFPSVRLHVFLFVLVVSSKSIFSAFLHHRNKCRICVLVHPAEVRRSRLLSIWQKTFVSAASTVLLAVAPHAENYSAPLSITNVETV